MEEQKWHTILLKYIPETAIPGVISLFKKHPCYLKIVNQRATRHGDFRRLPDGRYQITVNNNLNAYQFLLTLVHEIAHLVTHLEYGQVKPHGKEWKHSFQQLMLPFVDPTIYPNDILPYLANYLINPKASTDTDVNLSIALKKYSPDNKKNYIFEIPLGSTFRFKGRIFTRGEKRRKRYFCTEQQTQKTYLFSPHAEVNSIEHHEK